MGELVSHGYLATPPAGSGPGILVIQEWWGLNDHIKDVADRFAAEGFVALAPDLYHGTVVTEPDEAGKAMMAMNIEQAGRDLSAAVDDLNARSTGTGIGVVGFCMGGGLALLLATRRPDVVQASVPFYGVIPWPAAQPDWSAVTASILGHYAGLDAFFTPELAKDLESELIDLGKDVEFHIYDGVDHAFFNDTRPEVHDAAAASLAWDRTLAFLRSSLG